MQFLSALLAFAAVMALMSTIVAVLIEGYISVRGLRSRGLRQLLEIYYREAVAPRLPSGAVRDAPASQARAFAARLTENPARAGGLGWGPRRFNRMTTRQLVEQLSRTPEGEEFLRLSDDDLRPHLEALAYEFDRLSDGVTDFFHRRTRFVSVLVAFVLAFALNIDSMRLYQSLVAYPQMRERVIAWAEQSDGQPLGAAGQANDLEAQLELLSSLSIPIGVSQYPYCSSYSPLMGVVDSTSLLHDPRCAGVDSLLAIGPDGTAAERFARFGGRLGQRAHGDTLVWIISVLIAGGMIGLGAPFWFNVYRRLAAAIPVVGAVSAAAARMRAPTADAAPPAEGRREDPEANSSDSLLIAARTAAGESPAVRDRSGVGHVTDDVRASASVEDNEPDTPPGVALGAGSAQRIAAASAGMGGMRRLRS